VFAVVTDARSVSRLLGKTLAAALSLATDYFIIGDQAA